MNWTVAWVRACVARAQPFGLHTPGARRAVPSRPRAVAHADAYDPTGKTTLIAAPGTRGPPGESAL